MDCFCQRENGNGCQDVRDSRNNLKCMCVCTCPTDRGLIFCRNPRCVCVCTCIKGNTWYCSRCTKMPPTDFDEKGETVVTVEDGTVSPPGPDFVGLARTLYDRETETSEDDSEWSEPEETDILLDADEARHLESRDDRDNIEDASETPQTAFRLLVPIRCPRVLVLPDGRKQYRCGDKVCNGSVIWSKYSVENLIREYPHAFFRKIPCRECHKSWYVHVPDVVAHNDPKARWFDYGTKQRCLLKERQQSGVYYSMLRIITLHTYMTFHCVFSLVSPHKHPNVDITYYHLCFFVCR